MTTYMHFMQLPKNMQIELGHMLIFVSEKNRPLLLSKGVLCAINAIALQSRLGTTFSLACRQDAGTLPAKSMEYMKPNGNTRTWHFDLLEMAWHQPQPSIVTLMHFSCTVLGVKNTTCNVRI